MSTPHADAVLAQPVPERLAGIELPRRQPYHPSPPDWRDELLYFLLVDRFSDGGEAERPMVDRARPADARTPDWRWDRWAESGAHRWQGGTLRGVRSKLDYLAGLGVSALWLSPVFRQRGHLDTYHGYGIQGFLDVDPRLGTRRDLVELVDAAHAKGIRVILDVIFNHSGCNWLYPGGEELPPYRAFPGHYELGAWVDREGRALAGAPATDDGVWPAELQAASNYTRAGSGNLGSGDIDDPHAEHKRSDFFSLRDFALDVPGTLDRLLAVYRYWIGLTDCDGLRIDTLKHVSYEEGRNFCGGIKEFTANLGKLNFLLVGEVAGGDFAQDRYLDLLGQNLDAALDIGEMRTTLHQVAKGLRPASDYFAGFDPGSAEMGSHRNLGLHHVSMVDDHDHVLGEKIRFSAEAADPRQITAAVALQLFTLGIPCLYYGSEQALCGPEPSTRHLLPSWRTGEHADRYLREAMFGPRHPRAAGLAGVRPGSHDAELPGFGPFGTAGAHCFDAGFPVYRRIAALARVRRAYPVLRKGRQYLRPVSVLGAPFRALGAGEIVAWSRILCDEEALCVVNAHGTEARGGDVVIDSSLNQPGGSLTVVASSAEIEGGAAHPVGARVPIRRAPDGTCYVEVRALPPSEVVVLINRP